MATRGIRISALGVLVAAALLIGSTGTAAALGYDSMDGCEGSWQRQFGVDVLVLDCQPGYATEHDRAYMFPRAPVQPGAPWRSQVNFDNAVWLFDAGARGKPSLIIDFHPQDGGLVADMYDDVNGDGDISYGLERGYPKSTESRFPTLRVTARDGWWVRDGRVNYNLRLAVDGPVMATPDLEAIGWYMRTDGHPDVVMEVHDPAGEGRPRWQMTQVQPPALGENAGFTRTILLVNEVADEPLVDTHILWPHLGLNGDPLPGEPGPGRLPLSRVVGASYGFTRPPGSSAPPIQIDWRGGRVAAVGEFLARGGARRWSVQSYVRFGQQRRSVANHVNPKAYYDLAGADDGHPDLLIEDLVRLPDDPISPVGAGAPAHLVHYSWDQDHQRRWSYRVGLFGRRPVPEIERPDGGVPASTVPYSRLPGWVIDNAWSAADFVAVELDGFWSWNGVPEGCGSCGIDPYYFGLESRRPTERFAPLPIGFRGEYASHLSDVVRLYVSSIDQRLHLYEAEAGLWKVGPTDEIASRSLGGPTLNQWQQRTEGATVAELTHLSDRLLYSDPGGLHIARAPESATVRLVRPPTSRAEWQALRQQLADVRRGPRGADLWSTFDRFREERIALPGATATELRPQPNGFRFVLYASVALPAGPLGPELEPGTYAVTYTRGQGFSARPAAPPQISLSSPRIKGDPAAELMSTRLAVEVHNRGDHDLSAAPVVFLASRPGQGAQAIAWTSVDLRGGDTVVADAVWNPPVGGEWDIEAAVLTTSGALSPKLRVVIGPAPPTDLNALLLVQQLRPFASGAISASLTLVMAIAVGLGFVLWHGSTGGRETDDR